MDIRTGSHGQLKFGFDTVATEGVKVHGVELQATIGGKRVTVFLDDSDLILIEQAATERRIAYAEILAEHNSPEELLPDTIACTMKAEGIPTDSTGMAILDDK